MQGHLRQRGNPPHGNWYAVIDERGPAGERKRRWINLKTTSKRQAERELAKRVAQQTDGTLPPPTKQTVSTLLEQYIESRKLAGRAPATLLNYAHHAERISARIGGVHITDLQPQHLRSLYAAELADADKRFQGEKRLSPTTVRHEHDLLRAALRDAVRQGILIRNPADMVSPPRRDRQEQKVLGPEEAARLLEVLTGHRLQAMIYLALTTGMRKGELIGLRWADVFLDENRMEVRVQRQYRPHEGITERELKEHRVTRPIELTEEEVSVLRAHRARQAEERLGVGEVWRDHGLVFPSETGTPLQPRNVQRFLDAALERAGLSHIRFHDLRHTAGTLLMRHDGRVNVAQQRLGHAKASTTIDLYGHALPGDQRVAAGRVQEAIRRASVPTKPGEEKSRANGSKAVAKRARNA